jgi:hypothetical protein
MNKVNKAVYIHRNKFTNQPFYVGCGNSSQRPNDFRGRSKEWFEYVEEHGLPIVEIVKDGLSIEKGKILEESTIATYGIISEGGVLINKSTKSVGVRTIDKAGRKRIGEGSKGRVQSEETLNKRGVVKIKVSEITKIIDEITKRVLDGDGIQDIDKSIAKRFGVAESVIYFIRIRKGSRYSKFPQTLTKGNFRAASVNQRRIGLGKKPMTKQELVDWAKNVDGDNPKKEAPKNRVKNKKKPLTKEQIQYRADIRASFKKK